MVVALRNRMQAFLADWAADLPEDPEALDGQQRMGWRDLFEDCPDLDFEAIPETANIADDAAVWPRRRVWQPPALVRQANMCRAFDGVEPNDVRVVVMGQDPYPDSIRATGRAFEDGGWNGQRPQTLAHSLKPMMLAAWATQANQEALFRAGGWPELTQMRAFRLPPQSSYFDYLAENGVLFVNAAWTHTKDGDIKHHLNLWQPVLRHLLRSLASRAEAPLLFVLLGLKAQKTFEESGAIEAARVNGTWGRTVDQLCLPHPSTAAFLRQNPWGSVNEFLLARDSEAIDWWPQDLAPIV